MTIRSLPHVLVAGLVSAVLAALLVSVSASPSQAARPSDDFPRMPRECATPKEKIPQEATVCALNPYDRFRSTVVIWGDSHAWMFIPAIKEAAVGRDVNLVAVVMGSCPPMDNQVKATDAAPECFRSNALGIKVVKRLKANGRPYRVVLAGSWQRYLHAFKVGDKTSYVGVMGRAMRAGTPRLVTTLTKLGATVDVIGQVATVPEARRRCAKGNNPFACQLPRARALPEEAATRRWVAGTFKRLLGPRYPIYVNSAFCTGQVCKGKTDSIRTWFDDFHLSRTRSRALAPSFVPTLDEVAPFARPMVP